MKTRASKPGGHVMAPEDAGEASPSSQPHPVIGVSPWGSLVGAFDAQVARRASEPALRYRRNGKWTNISWLEWHDQARAVAAALIALGVEPGDRVAIVSRSRVEWAIADLGILMAGAATTAVSPWSTPEHTAFILNESGAKIVLCEEAVQLGKLAAHWVELPALQHAVCFEDRSRLPERSVLQALFERHVDVDQRVSVSTWTQLLSLGHREAHDLDRVLSYRTSSLTRDHLATLAYTSGTTGTPKGVLLSHGNLLYSTERIAAALSLTPDDELLLSLPLAQVFARFILLSAFHGGFASVIDHDLSGLWHQCRELRPTAVVTVPRLYEGLYEQLNRADPALVHATLGGRLRLLGSGGAPLSAHVASFVNTAGLPLIEGYGLTESSGLVTLTAPGEADGSNVGAALPGTDVRIAPDGEVLASGPGVMQGYYRRSDENRRALVSAEGKLWLRTGDLGRLDARGRLTLLGRKPNLIR